MSYRKVFIYLGKLSDNNYCDIASTCKKVLEGNFKHNSHDITRSLHFLSINFGFIIRMHAKYEVFIAHNSKVRVKMKVWKLKT